MLPKTPSLAFKEQIEGQIDAFGPVVFAALISEVCSEKADHLRANWQDNTLANVWERIGKHFAPTDRLNNLGKMAGFADRAP